MQIKIALAGNPNCGKTTLFNALTGSNQFVGNWPGVTVEKKEGKLKKHDDVVITDLPGIYSLSPYTLEEVVARNYLINERPNVILNVIDATNLERNLYLTTQLLEIGIPVVIALNMTDIVKKNGDSIKVDQLSRRLGCKIIEISALKGENVMQAAEQAVNTAKAGAILPEHVFSGVVEHALAHIEEAVAHDLPEERQRWYAIKIFERDQKVIQSLNIPKDRLNHIENDIKAAEAELDDDSESIITNERYVYIAELLRGCYKKKNAGKLSLSDKIDRVVTNRFAALPIFAAIMFLVYFISVTTIGSWCTEFVNDGLFGEGFHLFGMQSNADGQNYSEVSQEYAHASAVVNGYLSYAEQKSYAGIADVQAAFDEQSQTYDKDKASQVIWEFYARIKDNPDYLMATYTTTDEQTMVSESATSTIAELGGAIDLLRLFDFTAPAPENYGVWVDGIPILIENALNSLNCNAVLRGVIVNGIVAGVGAVLGFIPQILVLFLLLAFLESCGYMARIAFVLDRIFRKFGLSGKSFIPMLIATGCGVPGIMASRTIESERDRRITIMTTTFMPCGAKLPFIAMIAGVVFNGAWWVAPFAYFLGMAAIVVSGIILKKTKAFAGEPSAFVMELPAYHMPTAASVFRSMWERGWSFIKKAGTIILLSTIIIWFLSYFGWTPEKGFGLLTAEQTNYSILAKLGGAICWIFAPVGFGSWQATVACITGIVAKENIVGTLSVLYGGTSAIAEYFTRVSGLSFLVFNLLCAPCFAAIGAIKREMNNGKLTVFAILYQCSFAYVIAFIVNQLGKLFSGRLVSDSVSLFGGILGVVIAFFALAALMYLLFKPNKEKTLKTK